MRRVMVAEYSPEEERDRGQVSVKRPALFHQFGIGHRISPNGLPLNQINTAIVEWPDGRVESVPIGRIRFID